MIPHEFELLLKNKASELEQYAMTKFSSTAGNITLRFIDGNFRAGGYQGATFKRWKKSKSKGTTLVNTGALRAGTYYTSQPGQATIINNIAYAKVHNEGFKGTVTVKAHTRNKYTKAKVGTGKFTKTGKERTQTLTHKSGQHGVKSHIRKVDIPQRQFMPITSNDSPVLNRAIEREISKDLLNIMKKL
jgi:phage gpG-like protein